MKAIERRLKNRQLEKKVEQLLGHYRSMNDYLDVMIIRAAIFDAILTYRIKKRKHWYERFLESIDDVFPFSMFRQEV